MASMRKTDRLDCVSSDTSSSSDAFVGVVVVLPVGSETGGGLVPSVGLGHTAVEHVLQVAAVTAALEVLVTLGLSKSETTIVTVLVVA